MRGITQSNHKPSVFAYFEPRYNVTKDLQLYAGIAGASISFPNRAAAEVDFYRRHSPDLRSRSRSISAPITIGTRADNASTAALRRFSASDCLANGYLPVNGNVIKSNMSFWEVYAKAHLTVNDQIAIGGAIYYSNSVLNSGADGTYVYGNAKFTAPGNLLPTGLGLYVSAEIGHWFLGHQRQLLLHQVGAAACTPPFPNGIPYTSYTTWNLGFGITKSVFTLDFRYYDTDLSKGDCNAFTSDHTARLAGHFTAINPGGFGSSWCGQTFFVKGSFDLTAMTNLK